MAVRGAERGAGVQITVLDESTSGSATEALTLDFLTERITVRELIRNRVYQEVRDYNATRSGTFRGLVQPEDAERTLNGFRMRQGRAIDWERQLDLAIKAFRGNGVIILVDGCQVEDLDDEIELRRDSRISFLRLIPLVGG
jgi:hypothetical protein